LLRARRSQLRAKDQPFCPSLPQNRSAMATAYDLFGNQNRAAMADRHTFAGPIRPGLERRHQFSFLKPRFPADWPFDSGSHSPTALPPILCPPLSPGCFLRGPRTIVRAILLFAASSDVFAATKAIAAATMKSAPAMAMRGLVSRLCWISSCLLWVPGWERRGRFSRLTAWPRAASTIDDRGLYV